MREIGTEFAYKKTKDFRKLEDRFQKKAIFQTQKHKIADKKTAYNEGCLYLRIQTYLDLTYLIRILYLNHVRGQPPSPQYLTK